MKILIFISVMAPGAVLGNFAYEVVYNKHPVVIEQHCPDSPILGDKYDCDFKILGGNNE